MADEDTKNAMMISALKKQKLPDIGPAPIPDGGQFSGGTWLGNQLFGDAAYDKAQHGALAEITRDLSLPQRLIDSSAEDMTHLGDHSVPIQSAGPAFEAAQLLMGPGMSSAEENAAGIFGGRLARTANQKMADTAETMAAHGKDPEEIRRATGWFQHPSDNKWRFEIPDNKSRFNYFPVPSDGLVSGSTGSLFHHPDLYVAYPDLADLNMKLQFMKNPSGLINKDGIYIAAPGYEQGRSIASHELQHAVQHIEGFSPGSNPSWYAHKLESELKNKNQPYNWNNITEEAFKNYRNTSGEVEARNVQQRLDYSPLQRLNSSPLAEQFAAAPEQNAINPVDMTLKILRGYR